jgi:molybdopterin-guanine dinucleotide biosynthesis protein A
LLVEALVDEAIEAAALDEDGSLRPLPCAVRREAALEVSERLLADGQRRLRLVFETLRTRTIPEVAWRTLDPAGATLRDIDTPEDLAKP